MFQAFCSMYSVVAGNRLIKYSYWLLYCCLVLAACNTTPKSSSQQAGNSVTVIELQAPAPLSKAETERLRRGCEGWYDSVLKKRGFNGGVVVAKKGNIVFEAYNGESAAQPPVANTDSTSFHIASVSKTFTAMAVLKLWQDGKCNIDDEFLKYFPTFIFPGVTIRTLLNHRSGLPNYVHFMENMGWNKKILISNEDVFDFLIEHKAEMKDIARPDTRFTYCNTNYALLALLIEKLSGKKYGDYLQQTFFTPLKMMHTFVYNSDTDSGKVTNSLDGRGNPIAFNFLDKVYGDKNVYSTPRDLLTWDRALTSGILFTEKTLAEAYTPYSNEKPGIRNYGLGWRMNNYPNGKKMIYHNGWWHGNNAAFVRLLQDSATIIVLGNKENHGIYHAKDMAELFGNYAGNTEEDETDPVNITTPPVKKLPPVAVPVTNLKKSKDLKKGQPVRIPTVKKITPPVKKKK